MPGLARQLTELSGIPRMGPSKTLVTNRPTAWISYSSYLAANIFGATFFLENGITIGGCSLFLLFNLNTFVNRESLLRFLERASSGVKGLVMTLSGEPLSDVIIGVRNRSGGQRGGWAGKNVTSSGRGEFWRILMPGSYTLTAWQPCIGGESQSLEVDVTNDQVKLTNFVFKSKMC